MNVKSSFLTWISGILIILGIVFISIGFYKKDVYYSSNKKENVYYSSNEKENVYVGGDAYNYIINSNYFTGYVSLGGICSLGGIILYSTAVLIDSKESSTSGKESSFSTKEDYDKLPEI